MNDKWIKYQEVDFDDPSILQYHIDTRDFHCHTSKEPFKPEKNDPVLNIDKLYKYGDEFFYTGQEVREMLDRYFKDSGGGEKRWRLFEIELLSGSWSLKYIRIYRVDKGLVVCTSYNRALRKEIAASKVVTDY
jgi:hypothetical protein